MLREPGIAKVVGIAHRDVRALISRQEPPADHVAIPEQPLQRNQTEQAQGTSRIGPKRAPRKDKRRARHSDEKPEVLTPLRQPPLLQPRTSSGEGRFRDAQGWDPIRCSLGPGTARHPRPRRGRHELRIAKLPQLRGSKVEQGLPILQQPQATETNSRVARIVGSMRRLLMWAGSVGTM